MSFKNILVTGGAGFIGSHTILLLLEKGFEVFLIDSFIGSKISVIEKIFKILGHMNINAKDRLHVIKGDIRNQKDIEKSFKKADFLKKPIDSVMHFAGLKSVEESISNPLAYWENNVHGTIQLLKVMEKYNCRKIVFSSSATVYKSKFNQLLNENDYCEPVNPYGRTKLAVERFLNDVQMSSPSEWRVACLRYFNPVGCHESSLIGEDPLGKVNNLFPQITRVAIGIKDKIKIFGSDWPTSDGTGIRDYIHVMDLAEGHLSALDYLSKEKPQILTLNLGTGKGTSVLELIKTFQKVNNVIIPHDFENRRPGDVAHLVADTSLSKCTLNWEPKFSIEDICRSGWHWQLKNSKGC